MEFKEVELKSRLSQISAGRAEILPSSEEKKKRSLLSKKVPQAPFKLSVSQRLTVHLQHMPLAAFSWDLDYQIMDWNPAAERIFGFSAEEAIGKNMLELLVPADVRADVKHILEDLCIKRSFQVHNINENLTKSGQRILCEWNNSALVDEEGRVIGAAAVAQDITERQRIEEALQESEHRYRTLVSIIPIGMAYTDTSGHITYVNDYLCQILEIDKD